MNQNLNYYQPHPKQQISQHFYKTKLEGLFYFESQKNSDNRGFFSEIVNLPELEAAIGHEFQIKQVNHSKSEPNVVRGLHAEGWNKLVTVTSGEIFSAIVDVRPNSPTYKQKLYFKLGADYQPQKSNGLYISQGLANSICVLKGPASYIYLVDKLYENRDKTGDRAISIFDEQLAIAWPIEKKQMIISERDKKAVKLEE
jgi:dTDP-4-dehydrorhamnose 3,5-epimerase